jgi:hypothetical protein
LSLPVLVSLTPADFEVQVIDECFRDVFFDDAAGQVGICSPTPQAPRAYRIGDGFKKKEKKLKKKPIPPLGE